MPAEDQHGVRREEFEVARHPQSGLVGRRRCREADKDLALGFIDALADQALHLVPVREAEVQELNLDVRDLGPDMGRQRNQAAGESLQQALLRRVNQKQAPSPGLRLPGSMRWVQAGDRALIPGTAEISKVFVLHELACPSPNETGLLWSQWGGEAGIPDCS